MTNFLSEISKGIKEGFQEMGELPEEKNEQAKLGIQLQLLENQLQLNLVNQTLDHLAIQDSEIGKIFAFTQTPIFLEKRSNFESRIAELNSFQNDLEGKNLNSDDLQAFGDYYEEALRGYQKSQKV